MKIFEVAGYDDNVSLDTIMEKYEEIVNNALTDNKFLYRGISTYSPFILGDSRDMNRGSKDSKSWYMRIMENDPDWSAFPDRKNSFICTNSKGEASEYAEFGRVYTVIPLDPNQVFGVAPHYDFWYSFNELRKLKDMDVDRLQAIIGRMTFKLDGIYATRIGKIPDGSYEKMAEKMAKYDALIATDPTMIDSFHYIPDEIKDSILARGILKTIETAIKPQHFEVVKAENLPTPTLRRGGHEVWFSGPALFINEEGMNLIREYE